MSAGRVAVLGGGRSSEHPVSLASAASVATGLRRAGYEVIEITIARDGSWGDGITLTPGAGFPGADVVFPVLHGPYGEDGVVQGLLEALDVPYVGSGVAASALCMDKVLFKEVMAAAGMPQVAYRAVTVSEFTADPDAVVAGLAPLGLPVFVKPARLGSSVGHRPGQPTPRRVQRRRWLRRSALTRWSSSRPPQLAWRSSAACSATPAAR